MRCTPEPFSLTSRWDTIHNFALLRLLLFRGFPNEVLRVLYSDFASLLEASSAELACSAPLHEGFLRSWKPVGCRTRPKSFSC
jgi:hypothetical protein